MNEKGKVEGSGRTFARKETGSRNVGIKESDEPYQINT